ncbi:MAG: DUF4254 domain-containing protein [Bacteroidota bacterium]|nr:DUF4254 domain-containing protein [Bacteroidota bacterium]
MHIRAVSFYTVFMTSIVGYHLKDDPEAKPECPYEKDSFEGLLFAKCWIDTVQWHLEDIIREPDIDPARALALKRRIDKLNQDRTDTVEKIDDYFAEQYKGIQIKKGARHSTESIGWAVDRLSILALKIFHVASELARIDATASHLLQCRNRKHVLDNQCKDLIKAIDWLILELASGKKRMKVYRQLKMYNDVEFNPVLYKKAQTA